MAVQKIKVSREKLLARMREVEAAEVKTYEAALGKFPKALDDYRAKVVAILESVTTKVKDSPHLAEKINNGYGGDLRIPFSGKFPDTPREPVYPNHSKAIRQVELSADDTLTIEVQGTFGKYL